VLKKQLLEKLDSFIPAQSSRYFEPFLGGGALFFYLTTERKNRPVTDSCLYYYYISDINSELHIQDPRYSKPICQNQK
jgi:DNA adenine methylase